MYRNLLIILAATGAGALSSQPILAAWEREDTALRQASQQRQDIRNGYYSAADLLEDDADDDIEEYQVSEQRKNAAHANAFLAQAYGRS